MRKEIAHFLCLENITRKCKPIVKKTGGIILVILTNGCCYSSCDDKWIWMRWTDKYALGMEKTSPFKCYRVSVSIEYMCVNMFFISYWWSSIIAVCKTWLFPIRNRMILRFDGFELGICLYNRFRCNKYHIDYLYLIGDRNEMIKIKISMIANKVLQHNIYIQCIAQIYQFY